MDNTTIILPDGKSVAWLIVAVAGPMLWIFLMAPPVWAATNQPQALEEVLVTALKREQRLVDVPLSISVLGEAAIKDSSASHLSELGDYPPNVISGSRYGGGFTIRGISGGGSAGFAPAMGVDVDTG